MAEVQLVIVDGPNAGRDFDLAGSLIVGRGDDAGIVLDDDEASRRHASFSSDEGGTVTVEDLGSTNGTFVNGDRITAPRSATNGDRIRVGKTTFEVRALTQATQLGTAIPDEGDLIETQATAIGHRIPDEEPIETQATALGHNVPAEPPATEPVAGAPGGPPAPGGPGAPPPEPVASEPPAAYEPPAPAPPPYEPTAPHAAEPTAASEPPPPAFPPPTGAPPPSTAPGGYPPPPAGPPAGFAPPPGQPPVAYAGAGQPPGGFGSYPAHYEADYPDDGISRWRPFLHGIMAWPHAFVLFFVAIAAYFGFFVAWFAILFTRRYPPGIFNFIVGTLRWSARVNGFVYLFTERYPAFSTEDDPSYPIRLRVEYPEGGISRWRVFVHYFMAIPHIFVLYFVAIGAFFGLLIAWFAIVFTRRYPRGIFDFIVGWQRWSMRVAAFVLLMTEEYPPFELK